MPVGQIAEEELMALMHAFAAKLNTSSLFKHEFIVSSRAPLLKLTHHILYYAGIRHVPQ
jgi:hypothetical protein